MDDKNLMENLILLEKGVCDLYLHGTLESAGTQKVHDAFDCALNCSLQIQDQLYEKMSAKGGYQTQQAASQQMQQIKDKFTMK